MKCLFFCLWPAKHTNCFVCVEIRKAQVYCEAIPSWGREYLDFFKLVEEKSLVTRDRISLGPPEKEKPDLRLVFLYIDTF